MAHSERIKDIRADIELLERLIDRALDERYGPLFDAATAVLRERRAELANLEAPEH